MINTSLAQDVFKDSGENISFVTLNLNRKNHTEEVEIIRIFASYYPSILRSMRIRCNQDHLKVSIGFSYNAWIYLFPNSPIPKELTTFQGISNTKYSMPGTPGDLFIHIRADRMAVVYEVQRQFTEILKSITYVIDETKGFRYFEGRAIIGFVDGTEVPVGEEAINCSLIDSKDDSFFTNGSYAFAQKWIHDMDKWNHMGQKIQEKAIGRRKLDDLELLDKNKFENAHTLASHLEENGIEEKIIRMNVPFSNPAHQETGTFFIGYSNHFSIIKKMLDQMIDMEDFLLSFSKVLSGQLYFIPSFNNLEDINNGKIN